MPTNFLKCPQIYGKIPTNLKKRPQIEKSKKLEESIKFIETKYSTLHEMVEPLEKDIK